MEIELNILDERIEPRRALGSTFIPAHIVRRVEVLGMTNTAGEAERYVAVLRGTYTDGSLRADVLVERTGGKMANLNGNRHAHRVAAVMSALRPMLASYKAANAAVPQEVE